jgi:ATP-binding cassette, subfamily B, bacterial
LPHEIVDNPGSMPLVLKNGKIEFKDVKFFFNPDKPVLNNISFVVEPGEKVGLVGPSGAGKSTLVRLLLRFFDIKNGEILIDGQNIQKITMESLHDNLSLVPQDPILFHRTLSENIRYGRSDATDEEVREAARMAHCDEFIEALPNKYDTYVGERGVKLSGGERQRVAIARAIIKNAPILILDEATSSLDSHSEALIQDALQTLMKGKTVIVIAHRLSTIRKMDRIIVIEGGEIVEEGNHDKLSETEGSLYKKLWTLQAGGFLLEEK